MPMRPAHFLLLMLINVVFAVAVVTVQILYGGELIRVGIDQDESWC